jgi:hypothetical protein
MDEAKIREIASDVVRELDLGERQVVVEPAMGGGTENDIQIRLVEGDGDGKAVVINLADENGQALDEDEARKRIRDHEDEARKRIREQLVVFAAIDVAA